MTLKDLMAADVAAVFLNMDEHAVEAVYLPKEGRYRSVPIVWDEDGSFSDDGDQQKRIEVGKAFCRKSPAGIDDPQFGDRLKLADGRIFVYTGEHSEVDAAAGCWTLHFQRTRPHRDNAAQGRR